MKYYSYISNRNGRKRRLCGVVDASHWLLAHASCCEMHNIDYVRFERHDAVLGAFYQGTGSQKVQAAVHQGPRQADLCVHSSWGVWIEQIALVDQ